MSDSAKTLNSDTSLTHTSAEEKRKMLKEAAEEKLKKENEIVASFKELVNDKLKPKPGGARQGG